MRSSCSLYIDAGYLLAASATRHTGTSLRNGIHVEFQPMINDLISQAVELSGLPILRVHWYDSARNGVADPQQQRIGSIPKVKLRLGRQGFEGQQKGVDLRMGLDLVTHARNGTSDVFFLVSGDDDLSEAVEEAQTHGVQVRILAVPSEQGRPHAVNRHLIQVADELHLIAERAIDANITRVESPQEVQAPAAAVDATPAVPAANMVPKPTDIRPRIAPPSATAAPANSGSVLAYSSTSGQESRYLDGSADSEQFFAAADAVVQAVFDSFRKSSGVEEFITLKQGKPSIPRDLDRALLLDLCERLSIYDLSDEQRFYMRQKFWEVVDHSS